MVGRSNSAAFNAAIAANVVKPRILVDAEFTGGTVYIWNGIGDLTWNSNTYSGVGNLLGVNTVVENLEATPETITIEFEGITAAYKSLALSSVDFKNQVTVRLAVLDTNDAVITDPDVLFIGNMDEVFMSEGKETSKFNLVVVNELSATQRVKERRYTDEDQKSIHSTDTAFRHAANAEKDTRWGSG